MQDAPPPAVYRLASREDWSRARAGGYLLYGAKDIEDGFLHLSTDAQLLDTAARYFSGRTDLAALELSSAIFGARLRMEPSTGGALFPHLYGACPARAVRAVRGLDWRGDRFAFTAIEAAR